MTVKQMNNILHKLPPDMEILIMSNENKAVNVCPDNVLLVGIVLDGGKVQQALLLNPCTCMPEVDDLVKNLPLN